MVKHGGGNQPDKNGVTKATIEIQRLDGSWHVKARRNGKPMENHTMFPKDWDNARIRAEVTSAWENRKIRGDRWEGTSKSGVRIEGHIHPRRTGYPIYEEPN